MAFLLFLGMALAGPAGAAGACEVRARWNDDPPYAMRLADGRLSGLNVELVELTLARMGCRARWVELPWARALVELEAGRLDLLPGGFRRPEREAFAFFVAQHELSRNRLFVRQADRVRVGGATRLGEVPWPGMRLGVQIGVVYGPEYAGLMMQSEFRSRLTQATTRRSLWQMLELGRVDGVLASEASARCFSLSADTPIASETSAISASVRVASRGWTTTSIATDLKPSGTPGPSSSTASSMPLARATGSRVWASSATRSQIDTSTS